MCLERGHVRGQTPLQASQERSMAIHSARKTTRRGSAKVGFGSWWFVRLVSCPMWVVLLLILSLFVLWKNTFCLLDKTICKNQLQWSQLQSWSVYVYDMWLHMQKQILILINTSTKFWKYRGISRMTESVARCNKNYVVLSILLRSLQLIAGGSSNVRSRDSSSLGPTRSLFTVFHMWGAESSPFTFLLDLSRIHLVSFFVSFLVSG